MSALARLLLDAGLEVVGTDLRDDPPTGPLLRSWGVEVRLGYDPENLDDDADLVVCGNAVTRTNPVVAAAADRGRLVAHMPAVVDRLIDPDRPRLVVAGTHGKSTTTAATAWLLAEAGLDPGWLIGAVPRFGDAGRLGTGPFVIEGDEYNASFFDRGAKFFHYRPHHLAVTNVEFDHADLYPDLASVVSAFERLVAGLPAEGSLQVAEPAEGLLTAVSTGAAATTLRARGFRVHGSDADGVRFSLGGEEFAFPLPGRHSAEDAALALLLAERVSVSLATAAPALSSFPGLLYRQQVLCPGPVTVVRDFGHHPTEIAVTLAAIRSAHPARPVWVAFEPRSYTARTDRMRAAYRRALSDVDRVWIGPVHRPEDLREPALDTGALASALGSGAVACPSLDALEEEISTAAVEAATTGRPPVVVCFSNGRMADVPERLAEVACRS